ncbi:hypothetical protein ACIGEP_01320 [Microbacterium sp. NPDC077663]|uniref:hypothetical protein n=1 Tax=Microbacterium sp. NPDC077663 TaxID=3364189 RepID=UPI0037C64EC3
MCSWLEDVRISSRALRSLISRVKAGELDLSEDRIRTPISDVRGCVIESIGRVRNSLTAEEIGRMVEAYERGATIRVVAAEFGLNRETVMRHLHRSGAKLRHQGLDEAGVAKARELYLSGETLAKVGAALGVAPGTAGRYLRASGVALRPPLFPSGRSSLSE